ncbi:MAG: prepilin-type N-terminal cleavage/methylation domain-containing protein [Planctomycetota bacterium]
MNALMDSPRSESRPAGRKLDDGFSLMEVAMAVSLLSILTISTLLTLVPVSRQTRLNREVEAATSEVRNVLEQVQSTPYAEILTAYPDGSTIAVERLEDGQMSIGYEDPAADPLVMNLAISWTSPQVGAMTRAFVTVKTK